MLGAQAPAAPKARLANAAAYLAKPDTLAGLAVEIRSLEALWCLFSTAKAPRLIQPSQYELAPISTERLL